MLQNLILQFGKQLGEKSRRDFFDKLSSETRKFRSIYGAAIQIRTGDLILTKDALYLLSYSSISQTALIL